MDFLFGFQGRIGRGKWWLGQLAILAIAFAGMLCIAVAIDKPVDPQALKRGDYPAGGVLLMMLAILVLATWVNVAVTVKR